MKLTDDQKMALYQEQVDDHKREVGGDVNEEYLELMDNEARIVNEQNEQEEAKDAIEYPRN